MLAQLIPLYLLVIKHARVTERWLCCSKQHHLGMFHRCIVDESTGNISLVTRLHVGWSFRWFISI